MAILAANLEYLSNRSRREREGMIVDRLVS